MLSWLVRVLLIALIVGWDTAHALPWFASDADEAQLVQEQLDALWPGAPIEVAVSPPDDTDGFWLDGDDLVLQRGSRHTARPVGGDAATAVVLARSWLRELASTEGWVPVVEAPPEEVPTESPPAAPRPLHVGAGAQDDLRDPGLLDGIRVIVGADLGRVDGHLGVFLATGQLTEYSELDREIDAFVTNDAPRQNHVDTFAVAAMVGRTLADGPGPRLAAGIEVRQFVVREHSLDSNGTDPRIELLASSSGLDVGPVLAGGLEVPVGAFVRLRVTQLASVRLRRRLPSGPVVMTVPLSVAIDGVFAP